MKTYKTTIEQINNIVKGMDKYIDCVNHIYGDYFKYYRDMEKLNEQ